MGTTATPTPDSDARRSTGSLPRSNERFSLALEAGAMGTWSWDLTTGEVVWDAALEAQYGLDPGTFDGRFETFVQMLHDDDRESAQARIAAALTADEDLHFEHRVVWPNGEVHWLEARGQVVRDRDGEIAGLVGIGMNIDSRKEWEVAEREAIALRILRDRTAIQVLQETLIRPEFPTLERYDIAARHRPAELDHGIGGDWYDVFAIGTDRVVVTIGDVTGHGVGAARMMAKLRHAARAYACEDADCTAVLGRINHFFHHFGADDEFATAQVAVIDASTNTLDIASAGHLPPLLAHETARVLPIPRGAPLGIAAGTTYTSARFDLPVGSSLVLYTDGLVERRGEDLDLGIRRLVTGVATADSADPRSVRDAALAACLREYEPRDDLCVLVVARNA